MVISNARIGGRASPRLVRARLAPWMVLLPAMLLLSTESAGAQSTQDFEEQDVVREPRTTRARAGELIVVFGGGIAGKGIGDTSPARSRLIDQAILDSEEAEQEVKKSGGRVRFKYRTALIGFSYVESATGSGLPFLPIKFRSGVPIVTPNWDIALPSERSLKMSLWAQPESAAADVIPTGLDRIGQRLLRLNGQFVATEILSEIRVYVMDSGIRGSHEQFGVVNNKKLSRVRESYDGFGGVSKDRCLFHGSRVAGIIAGTKYGVSPSIILHSVRVMDCNDNVNLARAIKGVDWATEHHLKVGAPFTAVANLSFAIDTQSTDEGLLIRLWAFETAIRNSMKAGITYVVAAGNGGKKACRFSPARLSNVITVASSDPNTDQRASDSNFGRCVDLFAPGVDVYSTESDNDVDSGYESGTSYAAPHVAGVAAIVLALNKGAKPPQVWTTIRKAANGKDTLFWCGIRDRQKAPNRLLHWGAGSRDGKTDAEPAPSPPLAC